MKMLQHELKKEESPANISLKEKKGRKKKNIGFLVVEGLFVEAIREIKNALDVVFFGQSKKISPVQAMVGAFFISRMEAKKVLDFLEDIPEATISPKHRIAKECTKYFLDSIQKNGTLSMEMNQSSIEIIYAARLITSFLSCIHVVLNEDSTFKERNEARDEFRAKWEYDHCFDCSKREDEEK